MSHRRNGRADEAQRHWLCCPQLNSVDRLQKALNYAELDFVYRCLSNLFSVLLALEDPQTSRPSATVARALFHVATATVGSDQITRYTRQICDVMSYEHIKDFGVR